MDKDQLTRHDDPAVAKDIVCHCHRLITDMSYPWLVGFRRPLFWQDWWEYVDIDRSAR